MILWYHIVLGSYKKKFQSHGPPSCYSGYTKPDTQRLLGLCYVKRGVDRSANTHSSGRFPPESGQKKKRDANNVLLFIAVSTVANTTT
jgi:hypothetical protein